MKKNATIVLVALIATALIIPQTLAATSQGLFYRMEDDDRFYFTLDVNDEGDSWESEIIYVEIENASKPIPDPLTYLGDLDYLDVAINFENDTSLGFLVLIFLYIPQLEYPVGNWALIDSLAVTDLEGMMFTEARDLSITNGNDYWGYSYKTNSSADTETTIWIDYSKFDGMLSNYNVEYLNTTTHEMISQWEISRFSYHNLRWGFNDGDKFDFHIVMTGDDSGFQDLDEDFYIEVAEDGLSIIPYAMTEWDDIPFIGGQLYWANDTPSFDPFLSHSWRIAVPIGNWSLLDDFIDDLTSVDTVTVDDADPWFWGYSWEDLDGDILMEVHTDYLKVDGFIARHTASFTNTTSSEVVGTISVERLNLERYTDRTAPTINHPDDLEFVEGTENQNITWIPTDDNPTTYEISVNGTVVDSGSWTSGSSIVLELDDFAVGEYNCTITVYDIADNSVMDLVVVTVTATGGGIPDIIMDNLQYIAIGVGAVVLIGVVVFMRRKS